MAKHHHNKKKEPDVDSWIPVAIMLVIFPPVGLIMLVKRFQNLSNEQSSERRAKSSSSAGWVLTILGALALFNSMHTLIPAALLGLGGLALLGYSRHLKKARRRFDKYLAVIGSRKVMRVRDIASAMPVSVEQACRDLELMIAEERFPDGAYLDMSTQALVIDGSAAPAACEIKLSFESVSPPRAEAAPEAPAPARPARREESAADMPDPYSQKLAEIRQLDEVIADEEVSARIRRIEEVTASIFEQVKLNPAKLPQINTFMNYYLPTTLKLLSAYSQLERQTVAGENIRISKQRIEKMLSQLVFAFEQQLDQMFESDALDISSDITVLERMMAKDGLSENPYTLPKRALKGNAAQASGGSAAAQVLREDKA